MAKKPAVSVGMPDELGFRRVIIDGKAAGEVRSPRQLRRVLHRAGLPVEHDIHWLGEDSTVWPDRAWRRRIVGVFMAVGLLWAANVLARIGIADTSDALTYGGRIAGVTFIVLTVVEVAAAIATLDYWGRRRFTYSGVLILFGATVAFCISSMLLIVQLIGQAYNGYALCWAALVLWSSWALYVLTRGRAWKGLQNPKRIAIGALIPTLLAAANLTYAQFYVPYVTSPLVESTAEFRAASLNKDGTVMYIPVHMQVKNSGQVPVYVLGSIFWVEGLPEGAKRFKLISSGEFVTPPGRPLNPGEEITQDTVVELNHPENSRYEAVSAKTEVWVIRKDRTKLAASYERSKKSIEILRKEGADKDPEGPPGVEFRYQSNLSNSNELLNATRGMQRVTLWWVRDAGDWTYIHVQVAPPDAEEPFNLRDLGNADANKETRERYGLTKVPGSMAQTPFLALLERAKEERERSAR
ncbi:hypothetical protein [Streptomyces sp. NPDC059949]|uniref:hypothetical protein n=1 Tax=Streptomyces sp. NPDC059949 TaxID=3347013 RepID=UPI003669BA5E